MRTASIRLALFLLIAGFAAHAQTKLPVDRIQFPSPSCTVPGQPYSPASGLCVPASSGSVGSSDVLGQTASQSTVNLVSSTAAAGKFRISYYADQNALCTTGSNAVMFTFSWTDATRSRSVNSVALTMGSSSLPSASIQGSLLIYAANATAITYTSTVTGACASGGPSTYDAHITVEVVQ